MIAEGQFSEMGRTYVKESKLVRSLRRELERQKFLTDYQTLQTLQKQKELQVKEMELEGQKEKTLRNKILLGFSLFLLAFAGFLAFQFHLRYVQKKKFSEVISYQKKEITDSISYASRIQQAVSIPGEQIKQVFPENFIFNRPKDIVSGDYFYMASKGGKNYIAVADCTGHGVPGAFMSMLGISLLKEVLWQEKELTANIVLNDLRDAIIKALHQTGRDEEAKDGMDIALCVIDPVNMSLEFSGANNPCYIVRDKKLIELKADRMPIGIHPIMESFTSKPSGIEKGDVIYMFSDGFKDQIGELTLKKFMASRFSELLINISIEAMNNQATLLEEAFTAWQGNMEQTDDILVAGIRV
jgi:serine phosphatase RsbU (regulator of sigma subunit)